jgi:hypothetical protein
MFKRALAQPGAARALAGLLAAVFGPGCGETLKDTYTIEIAGPPDVFAGATTVDLMISGRVVGSRAVSGSGAFEIEAPDLDPTATRTVIIAIRALDAAGKVVAFGQTQQMEVLKLSPGIRVFVQKPGTLVRGRDLSIKTRDHFAVPADSDAFGPELTEEVTVPVFGAGRMTVPAAGGEQELLSNELYVYNPITHVQQAIGATTGGLRAEAAAISRQERVYVFGGLSQTNIREPPKTSAQLDLFEVGRERFSSFFLRTAGPFEGGAGTARKRSVLAWAGRPVFAFGGLDPDDQPLDSVVVIDPEANTQQPIALLGRKMAAAREGHTATTVSTTENWGNILIYGGAAAGQPVAEVFEPMKQEWLPIDVPAGVAEGQPGHPGTGRREHVALNLSIPEARVLILGGLGDDGMPRADSIVYLPGQRRFAPGPLTLRRARAGFVAFVIKDDLVVVGGYEPGPGGVRKPIDTAEIYDIRTWQLQSEPPAVPRARATATSLPNLSVVILGGETAGSSSNAVEIYQPRQ